MKIALGLLLAAAAAGCGDDGPATPADAPVDAVDEQVQRGRYVANTLGACTFCHTPLLPNGQRDETRLLAGIDCFFDLDPATAGFGCLSSRNLTNHETGLKNATDAQIKDAIRNGKRTDDKFLTPVMPFWVFHNMTDEDVDAVVAYLRTLPPVENQVPPNEEPWASINDGTATGGMPSAVPIDPADIPLPPAGPNQASAMRGRYLSSMAGLCLDCHTPDLPQPGIRPIDMARPYGGGRMFPAPDLGLLVPPYPPIIATRNLTPHATGLQGFTVAQIKAAIADGKDRDGNAVCAGTHGSMISPYAALDPQDLEDIATYISTLPPIDNDTGENCAGPPVP